MRSRANDVAFSIVAFVFAFAFIMAATLWVYP